MCVCERNYGEIEWDDEAYYNDNSWCNGHIVHSIKFAFHSGGHFGDANTSCLIDILFLFCQQTRRVGCRIWRKYDKTVCSTLLHYLFLNPIFYLLFACAVSADTLWCDNFILNLYKLIWIFLAKQLTCESPDSVRMSDARCYMRPKIKQTLNVVDIFSPAH